MSAFPKEEVTKITRNRIALIMGEPELEEQIEDHVPLAEYGMDSIKMINLIVQLEDQFQIEFEDEELLMENFGDLDKTISVLMDKLGVAT